MLVHLLPAICASVLGASACQQDQPTGVVGPRVHVDQPPQRDTALAPSADTYIRQASPNQNQGVDLILRLQSSGKNRVLLRWDQGALAQAVAGGTVTSARLELTISDLGDNWGTSGRTIELHRMTQAWTELGATWNCAADSVPGNSRADCAGATAWDMDHSATYPFAAETTATALLRNGQTGVVSFDVTADVRAWLAGQPNNGWLLKKTVEGEPGKVDFGSRESGSPPRLAIAVVAADTGRPPVPAAFRYPADTTHFAIYPADTTVRYYRDLVVIQFRDSVSGDGVRSIFARYHAVIVGGLPEWPAYVVRVPDPGPTYGALDSLLAAVSQEPRVRLAFGVTFHGAYSPQSRFPNDGSGATRADWLQPSASLLPFLAVRSTLAWGCETGQYGDPPVPVGVIDFEFDAGHPDLSRSLVANEEPDSADLADLPELHRRDYLSHGTAVAGVLTAQGDNNTGIAGVMWRTALHTYAMARGTAAVKDPVLYLGRYLAHAGDAGVRVLVTSTYFGAATPSDVAAIESVMSAYLSRGRGNLWVIAVADNSPDMSLGNLQTAQGDIGTFVAAAQLYASGYGDNILLVGGTDRGGARWLGSMDVHGAMEIVAPAVGITTLAKRDSFPSGTFADSGTSLSAPMVAGVAAQLLAMDPSLSAAELKGYLINGAQQPRMNPRTGQMDPRLAVRVDGFTDHPYQLDAYGSLALLSADRPGTPICGYPARVPASGDPDVTSVILEPPGRQARYLQVPGAHWATALSVAQGGRRIAVVDSPQDDTAWGSIEIDYHGARLGYVPFAQRLYLEKDTVDLLWGLYLTRFVLHRGRPDTLNPIGPYVNADWANGGDVGVSPTADQVVFQLDRISGDLCDGVSEGAYLVPLLGGSAVPVGQIQNCEQTYSEIAWSHDGRRAVLLSASGAAPSAITSIQSSGTGQVVPFSGVNQSGPHYLPDDSLLQLGENDQSGGECTIALRSSSDVGRLISTKSGRWPIDCTYSTWTMTFPNSRGDLRLLEPTGASALRGTNGFALGRPALDLKHALGRVHPPRRARSRAQVN